MTEHGESTRGCATLFAKSLGAHGIDEPSTASRAALRAPQLTDHSLLVQFSASMVAPGSRDKAAVPVVHTRQSALSIRSSAFMTGDCWAMAIRTSCSLMGCP